MEVESKDDVAHVDARKMNNKNAGPVLQSKEKGFLQHSANVTRMNMAANECSEQSSSQKRRTQFLANNYCGETALLPGAWVASGSDEIVDVLIYVADPKPIISVAKNNGAGDKLKDRDKDQSNHSSHKSADKDLDERLHPQDKEESKAVSRFTDDRK